LDPEDGRFRGEPSLPLLGSLLDGPLFAFARPSVWSSRQTLELPVRWAHLVDGADSLDEITGREVIAVHGVHLDEAMIRRLDDPTMSAITAVIIIDDREGRTHQALLGRLGPDRLGIITTTRPVSGLRLVEEIQLAVIDARYRVFQAAQHAHEAFNRLAMAGAHPSEIVHRLARMTGGAAVLEDAARRVIAYDSGLLDADAVLGDWARRSRAAESPARTSIAGPEGWLVSSIEVRGERWGRLAVICSSPIDPGDLVLAERAASAITLSWILQDSPGAVMARSRRNFLSDLLDGRLGSDEEIMQRARSLDFPTEGVQYGMLMIQLQPERARISNDEAVEEDSRAVMRAADSVRMPCLVTPRGRLRYAVLCALSPRKEPKGQYGPLALRLRAELLKEAGGGALIAGGTPVPYLAEILRPAAEARQALDAAWAINAPQDGVVTLKEVGLPGVLHALQGEPVIQAFVERTLSPLLQYEARHGIQLLTILSAYLDHPHNKLAAAQAAHVGRSSLYERLRLIERILDVDLSDATQRTTLHAALMIRAFGHDLASRNEDRSPA
jgi:purine catabolism regulator